MKALAFLPPSPTARLAAYADEDGSVITRPVDYFVLTDAGGIERTSPIKGVNANDGLCESDENFLGYASSDAEAAERFGEQAKTFAKK